jgi:hypothetical protein
MNHQQRAPAHTPCTTPVWGLPLTRQSNATLHTALADQCVGHQGKQYGAPCRGVDRPMLCATGAAHTQAGVLHDKEKL